MPLHEELPIRKSRVDRSLHEWIPPPLAIPTVPEPSPEPFVLFEPPALDDLLATDVFHQSIDDYSKEFMSQLKSSYVLALPNAAWGPAASMPAIVLPLQDTFGAPSTNPPTCRRRAATGGRGTLGLLFASLGNKCSIQII
ncbi:hypothetical protein AVEN_96868-1 [Araneus ventricosus]|uniref:Uncharacterized protein n=1 Tax=Araneus ventricosus TaxID=182803 RepID=A0A4Y2W536_ARAVE|nr:hypothetical protein AVEN_96868-1 [Araneus ventricosus]